MNFAPPLVSNWGAVCEEKAVAGPSSLRDLDRSEFELACRVIPGARIFEMSTAVLSDDIDRQNHVNNTVYLRWVQEVAVAHWRALASPEAQQAVSWVVVRHEIDYKAPGCLGDEIVLRTWVGQATRLKFERLTEIRRKADDRVLATARTLWVPINSETGKPTRVAEDVRASFSVAEPAC